MGRHYLRCWGSEGELLCDYVPVTDPNGEACLYDLCRNKPYYSGGAGKFVAGPLLHDPATSFMVTSSIGTEYGAGRYGAVEVAAGETLSVTTPDVLSDDKTATCSGYRLFHFDADLTNYVEVAGSPFAETSYTVQAEDVGAGVKLEWQWTENFKVMAAANSAADLVALDGGAAAAEVSAWYTNGATATAVYLTEGQPRFLAGAPADAAYPNATTVVFSVKSPIALSATDYAYLDENVFSSVAPTSVTTNYGALVIYEFATPAAPFAVYAKSPVTIEERDGSYRVVGKNESFMIAEGKTTVSISIGNNAARRFTFEPFDCYPIVAGEARPTPAIALNGAALTKGVDYDLYYENATAAGEATMVIVGKTGTVAAGLAQRYGYTAESVIFVKPEATGDGTSWADATSLTNAVATMPTDGSRAIWCATGDYALDATLTVAKPLTLRGGFAADDANEPTKKSASAWTVLNGQATLNPILSVTAAKKISVFDCTFANAKGRAVYSEAAGTFAFTDCRFLHNCCGGIASDFHGSAVRLSTTASAAFTRCDFLGNVRANVGWGTVCFESSGTYLMEDCAFVTNGIPLSQAPGSKFGSSWSRAAAVYANGCASLTLRRTRFSANREQSYSDGSQGGIVYSISTKTTIDHCVFSGNEVTSTGSSRGNVGIVFVDHGSKNVESVITGCTFADNLVDTTTGGAIVRFVGSAGTGVVRNSIFSGNRGGKYLLGAKDLVFAGSVSGSVTYTTFDEATAAAALSPESAAGAGVNFGAEAKFVTTFDESWLRTDDYLAFTYAELTNAATKIDVHLLSPAGYCTDAGVWRTDTDVLSPAIDKGDPADDVGEEPDPNGGRLNLGAYGGTAEASKTSVSNPQVGSLVVDFPGEYTQPQLTLTMGGEGVYSVQTVLETSTNGVDWTLSSQHVATNGDVYVWLVGGYFPEAKDGGKVYWRVSVIAGETTVTGASGSEDVPADKVMPPWSGKGGDPATIIHVRAGALGKGDGTSWTDAFTTLDDALGAVTAAKHEIWIANTVSPANAGTAVTRLIGVDLFLRGGFTAVENTPEERTEGAVSTLDGLCTGDGPAISSGAHALVCERIVFARGYQRGLTATSSKMAFTNCVFRKNGYIKTDVYGHGANLDSNGGQIILANCAFEENIATNAGGRGTGLWLEGGGQCVMENCLFVSNGVPSWSGCSGEGAIMNIGVKHLVARGCRFTDNFIKNYGAAAGFWAENVAAGSTYRFTNCLFARNKETSGNGGALFLIWNAYGANTTEVENCTFVLNSSVAGHVSGLQSHADSSRLFVKNSIFHQNRTGAALGCDVAGFGQVDVGYSCFDATNFFSSANLTTNAVLFCNPEFVSDEAATLNVHLKGLGGYIDETTLEKVKGVKPASPCIDMGDPKSDYKRETKPRGRRVNMGFYGNTPYQTQTPSGGVFSVR